MALFANNDNPDVDFERINILFSYTKYGYVGIFLGASFFGYVVWNLASPTIALSWMGVLFVSYIPRMILSARFFQKSAKREINKDNIRKWERGFFYNSILPFICFSAAVFLPYGYNILDGLMFYAIIAMTLLSGGVLAYSTSLPILFLFINISMLPLVARCFLVGEDLFSALGFTLAFSYLILSSLIPRQHRTLLENITLKIENQYQSLTDPLTKLGNRRRLRLRIEDLIPVSQRRKDTFSIILLDIDLFKDFNDKYGHIAGDDMLIKVSAILLECSRDQDLVVRYGGEEFLIVLPSTKIEDAIVLTERIQRAVKKDTEITISAGLAMHEEGMGFDELVKKADDGLYKAKDAGRDRYELAAANLETQAAIT